MALCRLPGVCTVSASVNRSHSPCDFPAAVQTAFGFDDAALALLARNSFDATFAPALDKRRWHAEVDAWLAESTGVATP